jgi:XTP/dITP diphosphohydrolase
VSPSLRPGDRLLVATHNPGKVIEFEGLLQPYGVKVVSAAALDLPEPEETGDTFVANAELKAVAAARATGLPALADDSGLVVHALGGAPGVVSARWAGPGRDFALARRRVLDELQATGGADRSAAFVAVLCLAWPDGRTEFYEGRTDGRITLLEEGDNGFGYDPIFRPDGHPLTFAAMPLPEKQALSHRGRAFQAFAKARLTGP